MKLKNKKIGLGICGSFCNHSKVEGIINALKKEGAEVIPIVTDSVKNLDTKFGKAKDFIEKIEKSSGEKIIYDIVGAEPIGPKNLVDVILILPCTGTTLAKFNSGIMDNAVLMAAKSHLRNLKPVVIAVSTNDGLSGSFENIAKLYNRKNIYFVPFMQDDYIKKPNSLVFKKEEVIKTIEMALDKKQYQPLLRE